MRGESERESKRTRAARARVNERAKPIATATVKAKRAHSTMSAHRQLVLCVVFLFC